MDFPISVEALLSVGGIGIWTTAWVQVLKKELPDWRWTNIFGLFWGILSAVGLQVILSWSAITAEAMVGAVAIGTFGAFGSTYGYEAFQNVKGIAGKGPRADG